MRINGSKTVVTPDGGQFNSINDGDDDGGDGHLNGSGCVSPSLRLTLTAVMVSS